MEVPVGVIRMHDLGGAEQWAMTVADGLAVGAMRRVLHGPAGCAPVPRALPLFLADLEVIGALFRAAQVALVNFQGAGLALAPPGTLELTRHERHLLRAAGSAQAEDALVMDNYLVKLAPHPRARTPLADAVAMLASSLATSGYWLRQAPLPASALHVARLHGHDLGELNIAWPHAARARRREFSPTEDKAK
jgi:hypothetical protein